MNPLGCLTLCVAIGLVLLLPLLFFAAVQVALGKLGIAPDVAFLLFLAMLVGSAINIPIRKIPCKRFVQVDPLAVLGLGGVLPHLQHLRKYCVVAVNVGGCVIPMLLVLYQVSLLVQTEKPLSSLMALLLAVSINVAVCWKLARPLQGVGIALPGLLPPLVAAASALLLQSQAAPPIAYVAGVLGPLVGGNLLHLRDMKSSPVGIASIGGAGTFDAIVLSGVIATILA